MKLNRTWTAVAAILLLMGTVGCQSGGQKLKETSLPVKDPPKVEITSKENKLAHGLKSLSGKRVTALFIYNLPDSYLIKAKALFNPPDYAAQEVTNLQSDRQEWFDEMIVTYCDDCKNITVEIPFKTLPEKILLGLIDKASLNREMNGKDIEALKPYFKSTDIFWIILGSENYEQHRGETADGLMISALAENTVTLRSYIYDLKAKSTVNKTVLHVTDRDLIIYEKLTENNNGEQKKPAILYDKMKDKFWPMPVGMSYDSPKFDDIYNYPPVPESIYIIKKGLSALGESLNP